MAVNHIDVITAKKWLDNKEAILIDVREPDEHYIQRISGALLHPLGSICDDVMPTTEKKILIHCQKGIRSRNACHKLAIQNNALELFNIEGGIEAWMQEGFSIESKKGSNLSLDRQMQLMTFLGVLIFGLLSCFVNPAIFGFCTVALFGASLNNKGRSILTKFMSSMPWNK